MAIVRTTPKETNTTGTTPPETGGTTGGTSDASLDRTKSVVNQGGAKPVARTPGARAMTNRPAATKPASANTFINDTMTELRRVVWPSRAEVQSGTVVTVGLLIFFGIYIFGLDAFFSWLFHAISLYPPTQ